MSNELDTLTFREINFRKEISFAEEKVIKKSFYKKAMLSSLHNI